MTANSSKTLANVPSMVAGLKWVRWLVPRNEVQKSAIEEAMSRVEYFVGTKLRCG